MAILGLGATFQVDNSGYVSILEITDIGGPSMTVDDVDTTHLLSANQFKEFLAGFGDGGVVTLEANYVKTQVTLLYGFIRQSRAWRIVFSDASKWDFNGHINAIDTSNPLEEEVTFTFSIKISGKPVFTQ